MQLKSLSSRLTLYQLIIVVLGSVGTLGVAVSVFLSDLRSERDDRLRTYADHLLGEPDGVTDVEQLVQHLRQRAFSSDLLSDPPWAFLAMHDSVLWSSDRRRVAESTFRRIARSAPNQKGFLDVRVEGHPYRLYRRALADGTSLSIVYSWDDLAGPRSRARKVTGLLFLLFIIVVGLGTWLLARRILLPVENVIHDADLVREQGIGSAVMPVHHSSPRAQSDLQSGDEILRLQHSFAAMLSHLRQRWEAEHRYIRLKAHDILDPLTILAIELQIDAEEENGDEKKRERYLRALRQIDEIRGVTSDLRLMSRYGLGTSRQQVKPIEMNDFLLDLASLLAPRLASRGIAVQTDLSDEEIVCLLNPATLEMVLTRLTVVIAGGQPAQSTIALRLRPLPDKAVVTIGSSVSTEGDPAVRDLRTHEQKATDLDEATSLARRIVHLDGGECSEVAMGRSGPEITIRFPRSSAV